MVGTAQNTNVLRFGVFELDLQAGELRKSGVKIKLQEQPFQILSLLLQRPGQVVTREEIRQHLWPADTFVDFDHSLNSAVKKLRQALGDDSDNARFIETLPRRGYRLIVPVWPDVPAAGAQISQGVAPASTNSSKRAFYYGFAFAALVVIAAGAVVLWKTANSGSSPPRVLGFTQLTNDGQAKFGPLTTDGSRIYFNELLPGLQTRIVQVSINGGEVVPIAVPLKRARWPISPATEASSCLPTMTWSIFLPFGPSLWLEDHHAGWGRSWHPMESLVLRPTVLSTTPTMGFT